MHQEAFWRDSTIVSWKILNFVNLNSNMIELKKSVSRWTRSRRKISPIIWSKQGTFDTERTGGSLSIILEKTDRWEIVLTSTMRWPHYTVYTKNLENNNSDQCHSGSIKNGTNHRVLPPVGGNGAIPGGAHDNSKKVHKWAYVQSDMVERGDPLFAVFGQNLRRATFQFFILLQLDRLQLAAVCCNRRWV